MKVLLYALRTPVFWIALLLPASLGAQAVTINKFFSPTSISVGGTSTLEFDLANPEGAGARTGVAFTDTLPAGVVVATPNGLNVISACTGGTITATAGSNSISLSGASLADAAGCVFTVNVTGTTVGTKANTTGNISWAGGTGGTASANLDVTVGAPTIAKSFGTSSVVTGANASLSFTITNPNAGASLTGLAFTDTFPAGLVVATPNGLAGSCGGGTITATAGSGSVSLTGATLAASGSCTFSVNVTGTTTGTKVNTTSTLTSNEAAAGAAATASITVTTPAPTIPALSPWALAGLMLLLAGCGWMLLRKLPAQS